MIGGKQFISLLIGSPTTATCLTKDTVAHEFIHALGKIFSFEIMKIKVLRFFYFFQKDLIMNKQDQIEIIMLSITQKICMIVRKNFKNFKIEPKNLSVNGIFINELENKMRVSEIFDYSLTKN